MPRIIIDVREPEEYAHSHVEGAINIPPAEIMAGAKALADVQKDTQLILYCNSGSRSNVCSHILHDMGYTNVVNAINQHHVRAKRMS